MAIFTWTPSFNPRLASAPRVNSSKFGDGYEQRVGDGINNNLAKWSVSFDLRIEAEAQAIKDFLDARNGAEAFEWTPPLSAAGWFVCRQWDIVQSGPAVYDISATFEEVPA